MWFSRGRAATTVVWGILIWGAMAAGGCAQILGIRVLGEESDEGVGGGGEGGMGASSSTESATGSTGAGSSAGGAGGMGSGPTSSGSGSSGSGGWGSGGWGGSGGAEQCSDCTGSSWNQVLSGMKQQVVNDVAVDKLGNIVFVGSFSGSSNFKGSCPPAVAASCPMETAGNQDVYIVKLDKTGAPLWVKHAGDAGNGQEALAVATDSGGNILVAGRFKEGSIDFGLGPLTNASVTAFDIFIAKFDPDGACIWSKKFGDGADQSVRNLAVDSSDNVLLVGDFLGTLDFGANPMSAGTGTDVFVAKLDLGGQALWSKQYGNTSNLFGFGIAVDAGGDVVITGQCNGVLDLGGGSVDCGTMYGDIFVAKLKSTGTYAWSKRFGNESAISEGRAVAVDGAGNVLITGRYGADLNFMTGDSPVVMNAGSDDTYISKLAGSTGDPLWSRAFAGPMNQLPTSIVIDLNKDIVITGSLSGSAKFGDATTLTSSGGNDIFVLKYSAGGDALCGINYGDLFSQAGTSLAVSSSGEVILGANMSGSVDLLCSPAVLSADQNDALIAPLKL